MKKTRITLTCLTLVAVMAVGYAFSTTDSAAEETTFFHVLIATNGTFTEASYELTVEELSTLFDGAVLASLLEGKHVRLSTPQAIDGASMFVDPDILEESVDVFGVFAVDVPWTCVKCCVGDEDCCCPEIEDPKDPDGD